MKLTENQALSIPFYGDTLYLLEHQGQPYTPMKPIVEAIGLDWAGQFSKIKDDLDRWSVEFIPMVAQDKKQRVMLCLPVRKLFGWMMTVSPNRVRPAIRDKVIQYQNECDDILWEHWSKKNNLNNLIGGLEPQAADRIVSLNHLQTICGHRRAAAEILYFFFQNEKTDLAEEGWFLMSSRLLAQYIPDFTNVGLNKGLNYLYQADLIFKDTEVGRKFPHYYKINHTILNQQLRQHELPAVNKKTIRMN